MIAADRTGSRLSWALAGAVLAVAVVAGSAWLGHREVAERWPDAAFAAQAPAAAAPPAAPSSSSAAQSTRRPSSRRQTAAQPRAPGASEPTSWPLWEFQLRQPVEPLDPPLTPLSWRLVGAANDGRQWQLIVLRQGKAEPEYFKVGQSLPGGYRVEAINEEEVTLRHRKRLMVLSYIGY